jgi:hypothetical protein
MKQIKMAYKIKQGKGREITKKEMYQLKKEGILTENMIKSIIKGRRNRKLKAWK